MHGVRAVREEALKGKAPRELSSMVEEGLVELMPRISVTLSFLVIRIILMLEHVPRIPVRWQELPLLEEILGSVLLMPHRD